MEKTTVSAVIVAYNEEKNIGRCIRSVKDCVDEIVVIDTGSDTTGQISKKLGAKVYRFKYTGIVELARNFAISKATSQWILLLDADEEIPNVLGQKIKELIVSEFSYYEIPRKNIVFAKWLKHSRWWPDYIIRLFKKDSLVWPEMVHAQPIPSGTGSKLEPREGMAIIHHHYSTVSQFIERLNKYTTFGSEKLIRESYRFEWIDLIKKPSSEFFSRFYFGEGYKDGIHGLALAILQSFSEFVMYLKVWETQVSFKDLEDEKPTEFKESVEKELTDVFLDFQYWVSKFSLGVKYLRSKVLRLFAKYLK